MGLFDKIINARQSDDKKQIHQRRSYINLSGGTLVTPDKSMQVSAYYRGVVFISTQIAKLPVFIKDVDNKKERNKLYKLLNKKPNSEVNAFNFKAALIQSAITYGNGYAEIERTITGDPVALWFIPENEVTPYRTTTGELVYKTRGNQGSEVWIPKEDMLHIRNLHTKDGFVGQGVASYAKEILGIALGSDKFANSTYANSAIPSGILKVPGTLSDEAYNRLKDAWKDEMGGRKTGSTALLEDGADYSAVGLDPEALQFLQTREFNVIEIARFLGVPPSKLYDTSSQKVKDVEQGGLDVANDTISVWTVNIQNEIDTKLMVGRYGKFESEFDLFSLFKADMNSRSTFYVKMMQVAAITPNQIREIEGQEKYDDGDRYFIATNNFSPMDRVDEIIDSQIDSGTSEGDKNNVTPPEADTNGGQMSAELSSTITKYLESRLK